MALTTDERGILEGRGRLLAGALVSSGPEVIEARLYALVGVLPSPQTDGGNAEAKVKIYQLALRGLPAWAVAEACEMALRGKVGGSGGRYLPSPGELHGAAERLVAAVAREKAEIDRLLNARIEPYVPTEEERAASIARVREAVNRTIDSNVMPKNEKAILESGRSLDDWGVRKPPPDKRTVEQDRVAAEKRLAELENDN